MQIKKKNTEGKKQEETKKGEVILPEKHHKWKGKEKLYVQESNYS